MGFKMFGKATSKKQNVITTNPECEILSNEEMVKKYFLHIDAEKRMAVEEWRKSQIATTLPEELYLGFLERANKNITADYNIAVLEPSVKDGEIFYHKDEVVATGFTIEEWSKMAKEFMPERHSDLALLDQLFVFYALRNVENLWSLQDVCDFTNNFGNYWDAPKAKKHIEHSGVRKAAGFCDGIGNTSKICRYDEFVFAITGGHFDKSGTEYPVGGHIKYTSNIKEMYRFSTGVVVCD